MDWMIDESNMRAISLAEVAFAEAKSRAGETVTVCSSKQILILTCSILADFEWIYGCSNLIQTFITG